MKKKDNRIILRCANKGCGATFMRDPKLLGQPERCAICLVTSVFTATNIDPKIGYAPKPRRKKK